jgi:hypothetical protein
MSKKLSWSSVRLPAGGMAAVKGEGENGLKGFRELSHHFSHISFYFINNENKKIKNNTVDKI